MGGGKPPTLYRNGDPFPYTRTTIAPLPDFMPQDKLTGWIVPRVVSTPARFFRDFKSTFDGSKALFSYLRPL